MILARHPDTGSVVVQNRYIILDGLRFHYRVWGSHGPTIVLVHATGFHGYVWKPIAQSLGPDHQVLALDQRGHGDSSKPDTGYNWEVFAHDLFQFLTLLGLQDVSAVGHSAGAIAIAVCAAAHPALLRSAVLIEPILFSPVAAGHLAENPMAQRARKRRMVWESRTAMFHSYRVREPFKMWREDVLWAYIEEGTMLRPDGGIELKCPGAIEAQIYDMAPQLDSFGVLPALTLPVLLLRGESTSAFPAGSAARALSLLPQGELKTVANTTHFLPMERPDAVERVIRRFIAR
jgi:pimeloyl-ACP methyl ester carboxylesterase